MDLRFGTWNVRSLYRSGSLKTVARELRKSDGTRAALNVQRIIHSSMGRRMKVQGFDGKVRSKEITRKTKA
jgi:hypothetical protein